MDTDVPAVEPGKDVAKNLEGNTMPYTETPENSDVALFKQQISSWGVAPSAANPADNPEQTEVLIDLSQKFKHLLGHSTSGEDLSASTASQKSPSVNDERPFAVEIPSDKIYSQNHKTDVHTESLTPTLRAEKSAGNKVPSADKNDQPELRESFGRKDLDNPYVAPVVTPLVSHSETIQTSGAIETHAAMIYQQIKDQVIDRILVSTNDIAANKTVKVVINPNVLQGTEVNFQKVGDVLSVQFASRNESSLQFLQVNQVDLQSYLQGELKQFRNVSVSVKASGNSTEYPDDGRSRNRYAYQTPDEDEQ